MGTAVCPWPLADPLTSLSNRIKTSPKTPLCISLRAASFRSQHFLYDKNRPVRASCSTQDPSTIHSLLELSPKPKAPCPGPPKLPHWTTVPAWNAAPPLSARDNDWMTGCRQTPLTQLRQWNIYLPGKRLQWQPDCGLHNAALFATHHRCPIFSLPPLVQRKKPRQKLL